MHPSTALGLLGAACFLTGSLAFLHDPLETTGIWLFVIGSAGMLVDAVGRAREERRDRRP